MTEEEKEKEKTEETPEVSDTEAEGSVKEDAAEVADGATDGASEDGGETDGEADGKEDEEEEEKRIINVEGEKKVVTSGDGEQKNWENEREHFRVFFPDAETPTITINEVDYEVVDASEKGVKFKKNEGECLLEDDQEITGKFTLKTGADCVVEGTVLRILPTMVVLLLTTGVPFKLLMSEQRRFISIYKHIYKG